MKRSLVLAVCLALPGLAWSYGGSYGSGKGKRAPKAAPGKETAISSSGAAVTVTQPGFNQIKGNSGGTSSGGVGGGGFQTNVFSKGGSGGGFQTNVLGNNGKPVVTAAPSRTGVGVSGGSVPTGLAGNAAPAGVSGAGAPAANAAPAGTGSNGSNVNGNCSKDQALVGGKCVALSSLTPTNFTAGAGASNSTNLGGVNLGNLPSGTGIGSGSNPATH
jgi:hypothetical protein